MHRKVRCAAATLFAVAVLTGMLVICKGNQQILAWPVAIWVFLLAWPSLKLVRHAASTKWCAGGFVSSWGIPLISVIAFCVSVSLGAKAIAKLEVATSIVQNELARAENLAYEGRLREALVALEILDVPPGMPREAARKHHNCGVILIQLRRPELAVEHLLLSLKYDRTNAQAAYLLAVLAIDKGRIDEGRIMLDMVLQLDPNYKPALKLRKKLRGEKPHQLWKTREK